MSNNYISCDFFGKRVLFLMSGKGYNSDFIEKLKSKNEIVSTISKYLRVEKKGKNYWACCPFHSEKTPSFCINEYDQYYHCFGCKESGDVITFIMKYENLDYPDAVEELAKNAGLELPKYSGDEKFLQKKKEKDELLSILNLAREHYKANIYLKEAKPAQEYIKKRGLGRRELENFEIGYSLNYDDLVNYLTGKSKKLEDIRKAGLIESGSKGYYDVLAGRLIFPIVNASNDCIGFSARDLTGKSMAKYKNTPSTPVFDKSKTVYAINLVKKEKQTNGIPNIIIVEGQIDVIAMHKAGFKQTVACLGTAFTNDHAKELKRYSENIVLCFDGDFAGIKASLRAIGILESAGLNVKVAMLPDGKDPDEYLKEFGADKLKELLQNAVPTTDFKILSVKKKYNLSHPADKTKFVSEALNVLRELSSETEKDVYLKVIKDISGVPLDVLRRDLLGQAREESHEEKLVKPLNVSSKELSYILACMLHRKEFADVKFDLSKLIQDPNQNALYSLIKERKNSGEELHITTLFDYFDVENQPEIKDIINYNFEEIKDEKQYFEECLWLVVESYLKDKQAKLTTMFKEATSQEERKKILEELNKLTKQVKNKNLEDFNA